MGQLAVAHPPSYTLDLYARVGILSFSEFHRTVPIGMFVRSASAALVLACLVASAPAASQGRSLAAHDGPSQPLDLVDLVRAENPDAAFTVEVAFADGRTVAVEDELVRFRVRSSQSGYLTLVNRNHQGGVALLYPNGFAPARRIEAGEGAFFPAGREFRFRVTGPFGQELVKAIVTPEPLVTAADVERLANSIGLVTAEGRPASDAGTALGGRFSPESWATGALYLTTAPASGARPADVPAVQIEPPPEPAGRYSESPGRAWRAAYREAVSYTHLTLPTKRIV